MGMVPIVASADDLPEALRYATLHPSARWYVASRADALGRSADVPAGWGAPVVAAAEAPDTPETTEPDPATKVELTDDEMVNPLVASASITAEERRKAADSGAALPDGSFPIRNRAELHKAVNLRKNGTASEEKVVGHIRKRAKDLGLEDDEKVVALTAAFGHHEGGPLHEAGKLFNEAMHPRGRDGQFITKGGRVVVIGGDGHKVEGTVEKVDVDATGKAQVHVKTDQGDLTAPAHSIEQAPTAKAHVVRSVDTGPGATPRTTTANAATRKANEAGTAYAHRKAAELHGKAAERSTGGLAVEHHRAAAEHVSAANKYREAEQAHRDAAVDRLTGNAPSGEPRNHAAENLRNAGDEQGARTRERAETGVGVGDRVTHTPTGHSGTVRAVHDDGTASVEYDRKGGIGGYSRSSTSDLQRHENQPAPRPTPTAHPETPTPHPADEQKPIRLEGNDSINLSTGEVTRRPKSEVSPSVAAGPSHVHFGPRRHEFHDEEANSHKFYESSVIAHNDGTASHVTSWGRIGAKPSYKADQHPDVASAFAAHDKKMAAQERKGYVDIGGSTDTGSAHIAAADRARGGAPVQDRVQARAAEERAADVPPGWQPTDSEAPDEGRDFQNAQVEAEAHAEAGWGSHAEAVKAHETGRPSQALEHVANGRESAEKLRQMGRHDAANDLGTALDDVEEQAGNNVAERGGSPTPYDQHAEEAQRLDEEASANPSAEASRAAAAAHGRAADHAPDLTTAGLHDGIADRHLRDAEAHDDAAREDYMDQAFAHLNDHYDAGYLERNNEGIVQHLDDSRGAGVPPSEAAESAAAEHDVPRLAGRPGSGGGDDLGTFVPEPSPHDDHALHGVGKSAVNKGVSDEATAKSRIDQILGNENHEQAHRDLAAMMSEAKLGGKQRARYRELLNQHHGIEGGGRPAGSLSADNPVKERLAAAQAKIREGHPDTGTHPADSGVGHVGEPLKTRKAAEARLARESDWLRRNGMQGEVTQLPDGTWSVRTTDGRAPADTRAAEQELVQNTSELGNGFGSQPGAAEMAQHLDRERNNPGGLLGDDTTKRANMEKLASSYSDRELGAAINRYPAGTMAGDVARAEKAKRTAPGGTVTGPITDDDARELAKAIERDSALPKNVKVGGTVKEGWSPSSSDSYKVSGEPKPVTVNGEVVGYVQRGKSGYYEMARGGNYRTGRWISEGSGYLAFDRSGARIRGRSLTDSNQRDAVMTLLERGDIERDRRVIKAREDAAAKRAEREAAAVVPAAPAEPPRPTPTSHPNVPDSPAWRTTHHEEEYAGEPTGELQPIHQTEINGHHILVDEPHTGEGWRYAITPKGDDFAHVRSDDDKSRNLPDHPLSGNFRTADEAKQAAIARARTLRNDAEERDANHRFHEEGLANQVQRERAGRASGDANTIEDAVANQNWHRDSIAGLRGQGAIPSRSFSTLTNAEQSQLISRFTPAAGSKRDRTANALRFYVEAKSKQERAVHGDRGSGLYTDTDRQRLANAEAGLKELGIDPKKIRETAQRMIGGPATS